MAKMENPEVEVVRFVNEDVIATSYYQYDSENRKWMYHSQSGSYEDNPTVNFGYGGNYNYTAQQAAEADGGNSYRYYYDPSTNSYNRQ